MKCPVCSASMTHRVGKHGSFFFCKDHGTASIQGGKLFCTGEIFKKFRASLEVESSQFISTAKKIDLEFEVRKQAMIFGVDITELDRFIEGGADAASDDDSHWMNVRPY